MRGSGPRAAGAAPAAGAGAGAGGGGAGLADRRGGLPQGTYRPARAV